MFDLYLASQSPRRRELLQQIGVLHRVIGVDVAERQQYREAAADYVQRLAREKSLAGWQLSSQSGGSGQPVLGADTVGVLDGAVLEKPRDRDHGVAMLLSLSARKHRVLTAVAVTSSVGQHCLLSETVVTFRAIDALQAARYWDSGEPADKACGYAVQGFGAVFVQHIAGSYSGVVGLPLAETCQLLRQHRVPYWNYSESGVS